MCGMCANTPSLCVLSCVIRFLHICIMNHSYVCHYAFLRVPLFCCVPWLIYHCEQWRWDHVGWWQTDHSEQDEEILLQHDSRRGLYTLKRVLYTLKRAICTFKRARYAYKEPFFTLWESLSKGCLPSLFYHSMIWSFDHLQQLSARLIVGDLSMTRTCATTHFYVCHESFDTVRNGDQMMSANAQEIILQQLSAGLTAEDLSVAELIHICTMTHPYVCHDVFLCVL